VRRATVEDATELAWLAAVTFPLACPPGSTPADQQAFIDAVLSARRFTEYLDDPARLLLEVFDDRHASWLGCSGYRSAGKERAKYVYQSDVRPLNRGNGGRHLEHSAEAFYGEELGNLH